MPIDKLLDLFFLQIRNLWRVDGLYFLGIERRMNTDVATEIDTKVWEAMAKIEAKSLRKLFNVDQNPDVSTIIDLLRKSSWALDQPFKTVELNNRQAVLAVNHCRTQKTRISKNLKEFPCKKVRFEYLRNFAKTLNPKVEVNCLVCPPDRHPKDVWCKWKFTM